MPQRPTSDTPTARARHPGAPKVAAGGHSARYTLALRLMLAPFLLGALLLIGIPAAGMLPLIFAAYDGLAPPRWSGLDNFAYVAADPLFWIAARNSLLFALVAVPLRVLGALGLALLLSRPRRGVAVYRAAVYLPTMIPDMAYALIWLWILNPLYGPLNQLLGALGLPAPPWLTQPHTAFIGVVLMALLQVGEGVVMLLAALQDIPRDYFQAARIDGAGRGQIFRFIVLPLLWPWLLLLTVRDVIFSTQGTFMPAYIMTGGGPYFATLFMPLLIYKEVFDRFRFGEAALMQLLLMLWLALALWLLYTLLGGWGYEGDV